MTNVVPFTGEKDDIMYITTEDDIIGVRGNAVDMVIAPDKTGVYFNREYVSNIELTAIVLLSGILDDCLIDEKEEE